MALLAAATPASGADQPTSIDRSEAFTQLQADARTIFIQEGDNPVKTCEVLGISFQNLLEGCVDPAASHDTLVFQIAKMMEGGDLQSYYAQAEAMLARVGGDYEQLPHVLGVSGEELFGQHSSSLRPEVKLWRVAGMLRNMHSGVYYHGIAANMMSGFEGDAASVAAAISEKLGAQITVPDELRGREVMAREFVRARAAQVLQLADWQPHELNGFTD